jgi:hypothetical protein
VVGEEAVADRCCMSAECVQTYCRQNDPLCALRCSKKVDLNFTFKLVARETAAGMWFLLCSQACYGKLKTTILGAEGTTLIQDCGKCGKRQIDPTPAEEYSQAEPGLLLCKDCFI